MTSTDSPPRDCALQTSSPLAERNRELLLLRDGALLLAYRMTGNVPDAEDVLQEAYLRAVRAQSPILSGIELRNWFLQIVANAARDLLRSEQGRRVRERKASMELASPPPSAPHAAEQNELKQRVETELARLDEKFRVPITLHYEQGLSFEQAAGVLGIPAGTLRVQACRGLEQLRERLGVSGRTMTAEVLIALLAAGVCFKATPALAASIESIVTSGAPAKPAVTSGAKIFLSSKSPAGIPLAFKIVVPAVLICAAAVALGIYWAESYYQSSKPVADENTMLVPLDMTPQPIAPTIAAAPLPPLEAIDNNPHSPRNMALRRNCANCHAGLPAAAPDAPGDPAHQDFQWAAAPNLLLQVDPARDGVIGQWERRGDGLAVKPAKHARLALNYVPPEEYDLRIEFTRTNGWGEVNQLFPVQDKAGLLSIGGWNSLYFGGGQTPDAIGNLNLRNNERHVVDIQVRRGSIAAVLDGNRRLSIDPAKSKYLCNTAWRLPDAETIGIAAWDCEVTFHRVAVRDVTGAGHFKEADANAARIATAEHWAGATDLIATADPKRNSIAGAWSLENRGLKVEPSPTARMELAYEPPEEYDFRIDFRRLDESTKDIVQINAVDGRQFAWKFSANNVSAIDTIGGKIHFASPAALMTPGLIHDKALHSSVVCVRKDGVSTYIDGKLLMRWRTNYGDMGTDWPLKNHRTLGLGAMESAVLFEKVLVKEISGKGTPAQPRTEKKDEGAF